MEIIHLILGKANPERMNGVNRVVHEMATMQTSLGYPVQVWGITAANVHDYPKRNFKTRLFQSHRNPFEVDCRLKAALLAKRGLITVHLHGAFIPCFYSISKWLHHYHIPFIITPHSSYNLVMMKKNALVKKIYFQFFEKRLLNRAFNIHLLGQTEWDGLQNIYHNRKSILMRYGFSRHPMPWPAEPKQELFSVVYCGRLSIHLKGLDILLHGFSTFHQLVPKSQLVIIGDGAEKNKLMDMAATLGIANAVVFKGSVYGLEKTRLLSACHVFAHPSRTDGIPATIVEAASIGLPCLVSKETNTGDIITQFDAGISMTQTTARHFFLGLQKMHQRIVVCNENDQLTKNAFAMIDEAFNWTVILKQFDALYKVALYEKNQYPITPHQASGTPQIA